MGIYFWQKESSDLLGSSASPRLGLDGRGLCIDEHLQFEL